MAEQHWPEPWPNLDDTLVDVATQLDQSNVSSAGYGTIEELARRLDLALRAIALLNDIAGQAEMALVEAMPEDAMAINGVGLLVRSEKPPRMSWHDEDSASRLRDDLSVAIARDIAFDVATGEIDPLKRNIAMVAAQAALDAVGKTGLNSVLSGAQKRYGVWMNEYKARQFGGYRLKIETPTGEPQ